MSDHSKMHAYLDWAKERLDEIDATLASFEASVAHVHTDVRERAHSALAKMRTSRDTFRQKIKDEKESTDAVWTRSKTELESEWRGFETSVESYLDAIGKDVEHREAAFRARADAQQKAWYAAMKRFDKATAKLAGEGKAELEVALKRMKTEAEAAKENLEQLRGAGGKSWSALKTALSETRAAFDRADQEVHAAFKRAA